MAAPLRNHCGMTGRCVYWTIKVEPHGRLLQTPLYSLGKKIDMTFGEAIECVIQALQSAGFGVLTDVDVAACKWPIARVESFAKFRKLVTMPMEERGRTLSGTGAGIFISLDALKRVCR